jgi:hypothetical protein
VVTVYRRRFKGELSRALVRKSPVNIYKQPQLRYLRPGFYDFKVGEEEKKSYFRSFFIIN